MVNVPVRSVALLLLLVASGCSRSGDANNPATASIPGSPANGSEGPSLEKAASDPQHPVVLIETSLGNITVRLLRAPTESPNTVSNFLRYVQENHYSDTIVHQVYRGQGFLAGGYGKNQVEKPAHTPIWNEARNGLKNRRGTVAMARLPDDKDSATCQFFVNVADNPGLDHRDDTPEGYGYCVFGEITEGQEVIDRIAAAPVRDTPAFERTPAEQIVIKSVKQVR